MLDALKRAAKTRYIRRLLTDDRRRRAHLPEAYGGLPPAMWGGSIDAQGRLQVAGVGLPGLATRFGTPLHVVDHDRLVGNYREFVGAFRQKQLRVELATSYKTNPLPGVLETLHEAGTWAEVISHFELWLALELGTAPERIVLNGPGKGRESIQLGVERGIRLINIDSIDEIAWVADSARRSERRQRVGLRVVTSQGWSSQFGTHIATGESMQAFAEMAKHPELVPCGLHMHLGTGIKDIAAYVQAIREVLQFAAELRTRLGIGIEYYDFGGGFGVPTVRSMDEWDGRMISLGHPARLAIPSECPTPADYADPIARLLAEFQPDAQQIIFEPGRAITSSAQTLLLTVVAVKNARSDVPKLILDGGKNITMPLGWETHQIFAANKMNAAADRVYDIYGPLCHPGDVVARYKRLPEMEAGDLVAIMDAGAYFIPNQMNFSLPRPAAVMVRNGQASEIRARESFSDIIRLDKLNGPHAGG